MTAPLERARTTVVDALMARGASGATTAFMGSGGEPTRTLSRQRLLADGATLSWLLGTLGTRCGDRVAILLPTSPELLVAIVGTWFAGAATVLLSPFAIQKKLARERLAEILAAATPRVLIAPEPVLRELAAAGLVPPDLATLSAEAIVGAATSTGPVRPAVVPAGSDAAHVQFTSGSTAGVRAAVIRHAQLVANVDAISARAGITPEDVGVSWLPLFHDMGFMSAVLPLFHGLPLYLIPTEAFLANPAVWLRVLSSVRGTISTAPAFAYELLARRVAERRLRDLDLAPWRHAWVGAEPVYASVVEAFEARFARSGFPKGSLRPCYGLAEATLAVTLPATGEPVRIAWIDARALSERGRAVPCPRGEGARAVVSVGPPVPGVAVEVRDADGGAADSEGVEGRIFVRGPSVATEYLGRDGAPLDLGGWLDTGDLGFLLGGELYVTGRVKDIIIRAGAKFRPHDIERVVAEVLDLRPDRVAAFADASARDREAVVVVAEVAAIEERVAAKVRAAVAREVGVAIDVLRAVRVGAIPKTTSGKTIRARCGELRHDAR